MVGPDDESTRAMRNRAQGGPGRVGMSGVRAADRHKGGGEVAELVGQGLERVHSQDGVDRRNEEHHGEGVDDGEQGGGEGVGNHAERLEAGEDAEDAEDSEEPQDRHPGPVCVDEAHDRYCGHGSGRRRGHWTATKEVLSRSSAVLCPRGQGNQSATSSEAVCLQIC